MGDYSIKAKLTQLFEVPIAVIQRFRSDRLPRHAASLAFSSLLALAPMMAIALAVLSSFDEMGSLVEDFIYQFLVPTSGIDIKLYIDEFASRAGQLTAIGTGAFFLTALLLLSNIETSFNDIWGVEDGRSLSAKLTVYWSLVTLGPFLMGASLTMSAYVTSLSMFTGQVATIGEVIVPIVLMMLAFLLLYLVMPNVQVSLMHGLVGAAVASVLFEITKRGFQAYLKNFGDYEVVYGALATLPIFLIWIYLSWVVALIGAEVVAVLQQKKLLEDTVIDRLESNLSYHEADNKEADNEEFDKTNDVDATDSDRQVVEATSNPVSSYPVSLDPVSSDSADR
ncbi:MAG: membrane protein [Porticoccaceae bacterium]|jgi:membrane protein